MNIAHEYDFIEALHRVNHTLHAHGKIDAGTPLHLFVEQILNRYTVMPQRITNCPCCNSDKIRKDFDFSETTLCCKNCGADFLHDGEIILNPKDL